MTSSAHIAGGITALTSALACSPFLDSPDADFDQQVTVWEPGVLYLKADPPVAGAWFGYSLTWGGNALAVTAPRENIVFGADTVARGGAVYVFEPNGGAWSQTKFVMPNVDPGDGVVPPKPGEPETIFSAIHAVLDDRWLMVGVASEDSGSASNQLDNSMPEAGALYVYDRAAPPTQSPRYMKALAPKPGAAFGFALALSDEWLIVGAPGDRGSSAGADPGSGLVYAYPRNGDSFDFPQTIEAPNAESGDSFGAALGLDRNLLVIGAPLKGMSDTGSVYVYRLLEDKWTFEDALKSGTSLSVEWFGYSVSVSGNAFAVGASGAWSCPGEEGFNFGRGAAHVFREQDGNWKLEQCLGPDNERIPAAFGHNVALRDDQLLVGAQFDSGASGVPDDKAGGSYRFKRTEAGTWALQRHYKAPNAGGADFFGTGVAFLPGYVAAGAVGESGAQAGPSADPRDDSRPATGAVYLFPDAP